MYFKLLNYPFWIISIFTFFILSIFGIFLLIFDIRDFFGDFGKTSRIFKIPGIFEIRISDFFL